VELPLEFIFNDPVLANIAEALESAIVAQISEMSDAEINAELQNQVL
jgi:hypothetical protein